MKFAIVRKSDQEVLRCYEADTKDDSSKNRSHLEAEPLCVHLEVPDELEERALVYASDAGQAATGAYAGVNYTAGSIGYSGNGDIAFDGVLTIAEVAAANSLTHDAGDDQVVPAEGTLTMSGGLPAERVEEDATLKTAAEDEDKNTTVAGLYKTFREESLTKMEEYMGTTSSDSATAEHETWKLMAETPSDYSGLGWKSPRQILDAAEEVLFAEGADLDTDQKVLDYANRCIALAKEYSIWRGNRYEQFRTDRAAALA